MLPYTQRQFFFFFSPFLHYAPPYHVLVVIVSNFFATASHNLSFLQVFKSVILYLTIYLTLFLGDTIISVSRSKISRLNFHPFYEGFLRISHKVTQVRAFPIKTLMMSKSALALGPDHESQSKSRIFYYLLLHAFLVCHHLNSPSPLSHDSGWRKVVCIKIAVMAAFNIWPLAMAKNIVTFKPKCIKPLPWKESKLGTPMHTYVFTLSAM